MWLHLSRDRKGVFGGAELRHAPALANLRLQILIRLGVVGDLHLGAIPLQFAFEVQSQRAEHNPFGEWSGHAEIGARWIATAACPQPSAMMTGRPSQHLRRKFILVVPRQWKQP